MQAVLQMKKIDMAALEQAAHNYPSDSAGELL